MFHTQLNCMASAVQSKKRNIEVFREPHHHPLLGARVCAARVLRAGNDVLLQLVCQREDGLSLLQTRSTLKFWNT